jgi:hypothetical protein
MCSIQIAVLLFIECRILLSPPYPFAIQFHLLDIHTKYDQGRSVEYFVSSYISSEEFSLRHPTGLCKRVGR